MAKEEDKGKGVFQSWFNMFIQNVFLQSFQAIFLMFLLQFLSAIYKSEDASDIVVAVLSIAGISGLMKFEKLIKEIFQIKDGKSGSMAGNFMTTMKGIGSAGQLAKRTTEPFKQHADIKKRRIGMDNAIKMKEITSKQNIPREGNSNFVGPARPTSSQIESNPDFVGPPRPQNQLNTGNSSNGGQNNNGTSNSQGLEVSLNRLTQALDRQGPEKAGSEKSLDQLKEEREEIGLQEKKARMQRFTRLGTTVASVGGALGSTEGGLAESLTAANYIDKPMDAIGDKVINNKVYKPRYKEASSNFEKAVRTESPDIEQAYKNLEKARSTMETSVMKEAADFLNSGAKRVYGKKLTKHLPNIRDIDNI